MARRKDSLMDDLILLPWWISGICAVVAFMFISPAILAVVQGTAGVMLALMAPGFFILGAIASFLHQLRRASLVEKQNSLESMKRLSWKQFEWMVGEAYRRQGYAVQESLGGGPDGGVDLVLHKGGRKILVQCKQWKKWKVGAPIVREQFGILTASNADWVYVVISGKFTSEAITFAKGKPVVLVDGDQLLKLVAGVQRGGAVKVAG